MPISGYKVGDAVVTPAGRTGTVVSVSRNGAEMCEVRTPDGQVRKFRTAALRRGR